MRKVLAAAVAAALGGSLAGCSIIEGLTPPTVPSYEEPKQAMWLNQNWTNNARYWFHHTPQGTQTIPVPYTWFMALEQPRLFYTGEPPMLRDPTYLARFGFIPSPASGSYDQSASFVQEGYSEDRAGPWTVPFDRQFYQGNPGGLPVGFALTDGQKDPTTGADLEPMLGFTCAACHTGHLSYDGTDIRIDGGPAVTNLEALTKAIGVSLAYTKLLPWRFGRFADRVLGADHTEAQYDELKAQFNEVLSLQLAETGPLKDVPVKDAPEGFARLDALNRIGTQVFYQDLWDYSEPGFDPKDNIARNDAPVNYPHIWSTSWFDWVQYDASIMQPMVRNAGESLGVSAKLNLTKSENLYGSTVLVDELYWMEDLLAGRQPETAQRRFNGLRAPQWPEAVLGSINQAKAKQGEFLYAAHCQRCHLPPVSSGQFWSETYWGELPNATGQYLKIRVVDIDDIGTDPAQAKVLETRRIKLPDIMQVPEFEVGDGGVICGGKEGTTTNDTLFAWALAYTTEKAVLSRYDSFTPPRTPEERLRMDGNRPNCVRATRGYKARPLNGIWATAPFLHNGSVLTLYDLLGPAADRPTSICLGDREFDPVKVGMVGACKDGTTRLDTTKPGNLATGHSFEAGYSGGKAKDGIVGPALSEDERLALIEFLKTQ